ncbi:hypothetical protein ZWY2020_052753 [Hordeum vulgare]|nr:hypothetical protein ZWY2020_052753 [Hordeum vulgare]
MHASLHLRRLHMCILQLQLPVNIGLPYIPNKKISKKVVIEIRDSMPCPPNKPDASAVDENDMFVHLYPLDSAKQFIRKPTDQQERHPMDFTPPSYNLGIDRSQSEPPIDLVRVVFAFLGCMVAMMA